MEASSTTEAAPGEDVEAGAAAAAAVPPPRHAARRAPRGRGRRVSRRRARRGPPRPPATAVPKARAGVVRRAASHDSVHAVAAAVRNAAFLPLLIVAVPRGPRSERVVSLSGVAAAGVARWVATEVSCFVCSMFRGSARPRRGVRTARRRDGRPAPAGCPSSTSLPFCFATFVQKGAPNKGNRPHIKGGGGKFLRATRAFFCERIF